MAFCPGTGTPEVGGPTSHQALSYVRTLGGIDFKGFDVVEVAPPYDNPAQITALLAANLIVALALIGSLSGRSGRCRREVGRRRAPSRG